MNSDGAADALGQATSKRDGGVRGSEILPDSDRDEPVNSHLRRTRERFVGAVGEILGIEMAMRIDEHGRYRSAVNEEEFRSLLDPNGLLRQGALRAPAPGAAFTVFSQAPYPVLDVGALKNQATRFFNAKLGLTVSKKYGAHPPAADAARVVVASDDGTAAGTRLCFGRRAFEADVAAAERADAGSNGMALLAQRCPTVWMVVFESEDDRVALLVATIFASVMLGPILSPSGDELFGVRTARLKLEGRASPYR